MKWPRGKSLGVLLLKGAVLIALLFFVLHDLDFGAIGRTLLRFPPAMFGLAVAVQLLTQVFQAWRWRVLVGRSDIPYKDYFGFVSLGYALALVAPSVLISDSANAWMMGRRNQTVLRSFSAMVAGRILGLLALSIFFVFSLPAHIWVFQKVPWQPRHSIWIGLLALLLLGAVVYGLFLRQRERVHRLWGELKVVVGRPRILMAGFALSGLVQGLQLFLPWIGFKAMAIPIALGDIFFFSPLITLLALAPVSIGQIGVREGLNIFFFTLLPGVAKEQLVAGFGYGYALFAVMGLLNLGLAAWLIPGEMKKKDA